MIPIYLVKIKDAEDSNQKLLQENREFTRDIGHLRNRLNRAESLVCSMGTPESIRKRDTSNGQERRREGAPTPDGDLERNGDEQGHSSSSTSSEDERTGAGTQQGTEPDASVPIDLSVSPTELTGNDKGTDLPLPAAKSSFKEALVSLQDQPSLDVRTLV